MRQQIIALLAVTIFGLACASGSHEGVAQSTPPTPAANAAAVRQSPVKAGDAAPDFTLQDQNGSKVTLSAARGQTPVVLVFYRGYW